MQEVNIDCEIEKSKQNEILINQRFEKGIVIDSNKISDYLYNSYLEGSDLLIDDHNTYRYFYDDINKVIIVFGDPEEQCYADDDNNDECENYTVEILESKGRF